MKQIQMPSWCQNMPQSDRIDMIQFELNRCAVASRTFFKDYGNLLSEKYFVYRLLAWNHGLCPVKNMIPHSKVSLMSNYIFVRKNAQITNFFS